MKKLSGALVFALLVLSFCSGSPASAQPRTLLTYAGSYSNSRTYALSDVVSVGSAYYISLTAGNIGNAPASSPTQWNVFGGTVPGPQGPPGLTGSANFPGNVTGNGSDANLTYSADTGQGDRKAFELYNTGEWDAALNSSFSGGQWVTATPGTAGKLARAFSYGTAQHNGFVIQSQLFYSASNVANLMCVSSAAKGTIATSGQEDCIGFTSAGFVQRIGGTDTVLEPPSALGGDNWYTATLWDLGGGVFTASLIPALPGSTFGGFTFIAGIGSIPSPVNFQVESTDATDLQRGLRYALGGPGQETLMVPMSPGTSNAPTLVELYDPAGTANYALIPASYRTGVQSPWVLYDHGFQGSGQGITNEGGLQQLTNALVQVGYTVVASSYSNNECMGNNPCVVDVGQAQTLWHRYLNLAPQPYVIAESMGGVVTWNAIAHSLLHPRAVVGIYPICNLAAVYADNTNPALQAAITASYGITGSNPYATATSGYDPMLNPASDFTSFPILIWSSYADTTVYRTTNEDPFATRVNAAGGNVVINTSTGVHGDTSNFDPKAVLAFFSAN